MNVREEITNLYWEIHSCAIRFDPEAVPKQVVDRALTSQVFLIGQAPGPSTQRLSGVPYMARSGKLSRTGQRLDRFLVRFGYTVDPDDHDRRYAYCTDIVQHYTGRGSGGDRPPTPQEQARYAGWLEQELELITPRVVVLLGGVAAKVFFERYLKLHAQPLTEIWGKGFGLLYSGRHMIVYAVPHPAFRFEHHKVDTIYEVTAYEIRHILDG